jgi:hypothetical protein
MSRARYELGFYILKDDILHSHRRENFKSHSEKRFSFKIRANGRSNNDLSFIAVDCVTSELLTTAKYRTVPTLSSYT